MKALLRLRKENKENESAVVRYNEHEATSKEICGESCHITIVIRSAARRF